MLIKSDFKEKTGLDPWKHQERVIKHLSNGNSVVLRAPTGSGKSEAVFVGYMINRGKTLPNKMIHSLPMRVLVDNIGQRYRDYITKNIKDDTNIEAHHGKNLKASLFYPEIVVTTLDQVVGGYATTPLNIPIRHGACVSGGVSSSFLVFDELQTFDPRIGLQSALIIVQHSCETNTPFVIMTATMPDRFMEKLSEDLEVKKVDTNKRHLKNVRNVKIHYLDHKLTEKNVVDFSKKYNKIIVICNTVDRARELYDKLKIKPKTLIHARFLDEDRKRIEEKVIKLFGKNSDGNKRHILISTQVIEVGIDISCNVMLSELAPIDSLIQRVGRCCRWGGKGDFYVFDVGDEHKDYAPYGNKEAKEIMISTRERLKEINGSVLDWIQEKNIVNDVLNPFVDGWFEWENTTKILNQIIEASYEGRKDKAAEAVRENLSCEVSIYDNPSNLVNPYVLNKMNLHFGILRKFFRDNENPDDNIMWKVDENNMIVFDNESRFKAFRVNTVSDIHPNGFYIINPQFASYDSEKGLLLQNNGYDREKFIKKKTIKDGETINHKYGDEPWVKHSLKTIKVFDKQFYPSFNFILNKYAKLWKLDENYFINIVRLLVGFHDIGKLNIKWQESAGWDGYTPLAHFKKDSCPPPHAVEGAYSLVRLLKSIRGRKSILKPSLCSIAHHHSTRAQQIKTFRYIDDWKNPCNEILSYIDLNNIDLELIIPHSSNTKIPFQINIKNEKIFRTYGIFSRIIKFCDLVATSGEKNAILDLENWYGNV